MGGVAACYTSGYLSCIYNCIPQPLQGDEQKQNELVDADRGDLHGFEVARLAATAVMHTRLHVRLTTLGSGECEATVTRLPLHDPPKGDLPVMWAQLQTAAAATATAMASLSALEQEGADARHIRISATKLEACRATEERLELSVRGAWVAASEALEGCAIDSSRQRLVLTNASDASARESGKLLPLLLRIETVAHILIWHDEATGKLARVELPRLHLTFVAVGACLMCEEEPGFFVSDRRSPQATIINPTQ